MKNMRVAFYCRVSTAEQTVENQLRELRRYCDSRGLKEVMVYKDEGVSGAKDRRLGLDNLMADARSRKFKMVIVWKFDRFARSTQHLLTALQEFHDLDIDFVSCSEGIDTSTAMGKMVFTFLSAIAEFERELIRERVKSGLERAKEEGVRLGRPRVGFDVAEAVRMQEEGLGVRRIAVRLGVSPSTVHRALKGLNEAVDKTHRS